MNTIITDKIVFGGDCIGKIDGKTVFVSGALPGETVEIKIITQKKDYDKARVVHIVKPSKHRIIPPCPLYGVCGGCNLQFASDDYQKVLRQSIMQDACDRAFYNSKTAIPKIEIIEIIDGKSLGYRSRFQFFNGGLKKRGSSEVVPLLDCPIAVPEIRTYLASKNKITIGKNYVFGDRRVHGTQKIFSTKTDTLCTVDIKDHNNIVQPISFDVRGFFQSNLELLEKTLPYLIEGLEGNHLLDMYAGVGTLSAFAGQTFKTITLVEHNKKALSFAKTNLKHLTTLGKKVQTYPLSGDKWVKTVATNVFDAVLVDPPRSGIEKSVLNWFCQNNIKQVRYLSCDPVTFARDLKKMCQNGYSIKRLMMLDFYPQTSHIESLAWLENEKK
ncbi:MAG TPA: TRAM domain-containing protein [Treponemataceae bacterium]|nr:TRAM domain-containing protein [Treponemataceae bacterium]